MNHGAPKHRTVAAPRPTKAIRIISAARPKKCVRWSVPPATSWLRRTFRRVTALIGGVAVLVALLASAVVIVEVLPLPKQGQLGSLAKKVLAFSIPELVPVRVPELVPVVIGDVIRKGSVPVVTGELLMGLTFTPVGLMVVRGAASGSEIPT